jgi:hypothetical protein
MDVEVFMDQLRVEFDLFPATVTTVNGRIPDVRASVVDKVLYVWSRTSSRPIVGPGPYTIIQSPVSTWRGSTSKGLTLTTEDGEISISLQGGCGCGNPLRSWNPWPGKRKIVVGLGNS